MLKKKVYSPKTNHTLYEDHFHFLVLTLSDSGLSASLKNVYFVLFSFFFDFHRATISCIIISYEETPNKV